MDGLQLARDIKARPELDKTRLIMLTSTYEAGNAREREQAGILRCVSKPIRQSELYEVVSGALTADREIGAAAAVAAPAATAADGHLARLRGRVLVAEDNRVNQKLAKAMLGTLGLAADIAGNGEEALALIEQQAYDVVLMDCQMPVMDGYQATRAVRAREAGGGKRLPIIALTANAMEGDRDQCLAAGMDDYLAKPYSRAQLQQALGRWLQAENVAALAPAEAAAVATPVPAVQVQAAAIDMKVLDRLRELDPSRSLGLARKILRVYLDSAGATLGQIEQAIAAGDAEALRRAAHSLKSSSANVGAETLSGLFKQLEGLGREGKPAEAGAVFAETRREYEQAVREIGLLLQDDT
jgi:CheY-like chemotaxis protein/HPt (histidine-containing phosphotransfer) domain-containing protein